MATSNLKIKVIIKPFFVKHPLFLYAAIKLGLFRYAVKFKINDKDIV